MDSTSTLRWHSGSHVIGRGFLALLLDEAELGGNPLHADEEHGDQEDTHGRREEHAADDGDAHAAAGSGTGTAGKGQGCR